MAFPSPRGSAFAHTYTYACACPRRPAQSFAQRMLLHQVNGRKKRSIGHGPRGVVGGPDH